MNRIESLKEGSLWITGEDNIADYFKSNFENLFQSNQNRVNVDFEELFSNERISVEENNALSKIPSEEEIKNNV